MSGTCRMVIARRDGCGRELLRDLTRPELHMRRGEPHDADGTVRLIRMRTSSVPSSVGVIPLNARPTAEAG